MTTTDYKVLSELPPISKESVDKCSYSSWYTTFEKYTPKSHIIKPLPEKFIEYIKQDGIYLPTNGKDSEKERSVNGKTDSDSDICWENSCMELASDDGSDKEEHPVTQRIDPLVDFPEFHLLLENKFLEINGPISPKLNWSSPKDAAWILPYNNTMLCREVNDLYLLLNASNYTMHDILTPYEDVPDREDEEGNCYELVLREWEDINPALEFRVFIACESRQILGISQRDMKTNYQFLENLKTGIQEKIEEFVETVFLKKDLFQNEKGVVIDVYVPRPFNKIWLIDVNAFSRSTDPLLFSWNELITKLGNGKSPKASVSDFDVEFRLVSKTAVGHRDHTENQMPIDIVQASIDPESLRELTYQWNEALKLQEKEDKETRDS
ncbi:related to Cell division cycle protein 123 [Saccharomycodes ludwigii]|uniref:Related to Cell division cycle protein 123 n=1 Tax=Saccharomycodes ludwigii TaxID=36035 RepID=A0A376B511_9ASCO|nr:hypothetical protein SCDLUD_000265 [Saccharomycodes ludwigii]KAH3902682.1 hypothetical protein SCDLUD_000265 [Saccharomycodes ludwigii]SSD59743.1 related to Cell division cycle protein 123 [Saccharomycodes ludwigii]